MASYFSRSLITRYAPLAPVSEVLGDGKHRDEVIAGEVLDPGSSVRELPYVTQAMAINAGGEEHSHKETTPLIGAPAPAATHDHDHEHEHKGVSPAPESSSAPAAHAAAAAPITSTSFDCRTISFWSVAIITLIYCVMELSAAVWIHSLTLMTDGFHKLSDVVSVFIAWWAIRAGKQSASFSMSYGWGRTEVVGSLTNAIFLLSLCLYILLDAIPQFIEPANRTGTKMGSLILTGVAGLGLLVNFVGTLIFAFTGQHHHHHHHGHDHGHDDHGHGDHGHKDHDHDHDHKEHEHGHDVEAGDSCRGSECKTAKKDKKDKKKKKHKMDLNIKAVFLHYLGDSITSIFVLLMGILLFFFGRPELTSSEVLSSGDTGVAKWVPYIDPATSILMIVFILFTTLPLTSECVRLLLQSAPEKMNARQLQRDLLRADGVLGAHALHVWEFTPGVVVCTVHIKYLEGTNANMIVRRVIKILHDNGIQHVTVQPEMVPAAQQSAQSSSGAAWQIDTVSHEESGSCVVKHIHK